MRNGHVGRGRCCCSAAPSVAHKSGNRQPDEKNRLRMIGRRCESRTPFWSCSTWNRGTKIRPGHRTVKSCDGDAAEKVAFPNVVIRRGFEENRKCRGLIPYPACHHPPESASPICAPCTFGGHARFHDGPRPGERTWFLQPGHGCVTNLTPRTPVLMDPAIGLILRRHRAGCRTCASKLSVMPGT